MKSWLFVLKQFIEDLEESIKAVILCVKIQCQNVEVLWQNIKIYKLILIWRIINDIILYFYINTI